MREDGLRSWRSLLPLLAGGFSVMTFHKLFQHINNVLEIHPNV